MYIYYEQAPFITWELVDAKLTKTYRQLPDTERSLTLSSAARYDCIVRWIDIVTHTEYRHALQSRRDTHCATVARMKVQMSTEPLSFVRFSEAKNCITRTPRPRPRHNGTPIGNDVAVLLIAVFTGCFLKWHGRHVRVHHRTTDESRVCDMQFSSKVEIDCEFVKDEYVVCVKMAVNSFPYEIFEIIVLILGRLEN